MNARKQKLLFDHLPKTAGSSLHATFRELFPQYSGDSVFSAHSQLLQRSDQAFIGGHLHFNPGEALSKEHYYCTVLRDPVERFISEFFFHKQEGRRLLSQGDISNPMLHDRQIAAAIRLNIEQYVSDGELVKRRFRNVQALHFAARVSSNPYELDNASLLDAAIASLDDYDFAGSFEQLQFMVDTIAREFGVGSIPIKRLKVTEPQSERDNISRKAIDIIKAENVVDYALIAWASQRFGWNSESDAPTTTTPLRPAIAAAHPETANQKVVPELASQDVIDRGFGSKSIKFVAVNCIGERSSVAAVDRGEDILIDMSIEASVAEPDLTIGVAVRDREAKLVYGVNSALLGRKLCIDKPGRFSARFRLHNRLGLGAYSITLALHKGVNHADGCFHWIDAAANFCVYAVAKPFEGYIDCDAELAFSEAPQDPELASGGPERFAADLSSDWETSAEARPHCPTAKRR